MEAVVGTVAKIGSAAAMDSVQTWARTLKSFRRHPVYFV